MSEEQMSTASSFDMIGDQEEKQRDQNGDELMASEQNNKTEHWAANELETDNVMDLRKRLAAAEAEKDEVVVPMNHWNNAECHPDLFVDDSLLVVERRGETDACRYAAVRAELMKVPRHCQGIFYFEVTIVKMDKFLLIGFAPQSLKPNAVTSFEDFSGCYFYGGYGIFYGHRVEGCKYNNCGMPYVGGKPKFGDGDVIGCGVNLATRQIIYTKNGERLDTSNLVVSKSDDLYPFVALWLIGDKVEANFGQREFEYKEIERGIGN